MNNNRDSTSLYRRKGPSSIVSVTSNVSALFQKPEDTIQCAQLSIEEQKHIRDVLKRDGSLRTLDQRRVSRLQRELSQKRDRLLANTDGNHCKLCNANLQFLIHPGYLCNHCGYEYCKQCVFIKKNDAGYHICQICHEESIQRLKTGKWLESFSHTDHTDGMIDPDSWKENLITYLEEADHHRDEEINSTVITKKKTGDRKLKKKMKSNSKVEITHYDDDDDKLPQNNNLSKSELSLAKMEVASKLTAKSENTSGLSQSLNLSRHSKPQELATYSLHSTASKGEYQSRKSASLSRASSEAKKHLNQMNIEDDDVKSDVSAATGIWECMKHSYSMSAICESNTNASLHELNSGNISTSEVTLADLLRERNKTLSALMSGIQLSKHSYGGSLMSLYSENDESYVSNIDVTGEVLLGMDYDYKKQIFIVFIKECRNLAPVQVRKKRSNPYVKCYLLPDKSKAGKRKTAVKKKTISPHFNETVTYSIAKGDLETRTLFVTVWHYQTLGHSIFLGEVLIPLSFRKFGDASPKWYPLQEKKEISVPLPILLYKGDISLALMYSTTPGGGSRVGERPGGEVHVYVKEAKNLTSSFKSAGVDSYVKAYVLPDRTAHNKQKTEVIRRNNSPMWNTLMCFPGISRSDLIDRSLEIKVWEASRVGNSAFLGGIRLNLGTGFHRNQPVTWMDATDDEIVLWRKMMEEPDVWHEAVFPLRTNLL